jgi:hypothetical protein
METRLLQRSGLADAGVDGEALLEGAATATSLRLPYCRYLVSALLDAVAAAADPTADQPQLIDYTVFCATWHAASLARLSDADLANAWRLAEYLLLDGACSSCLEDVVVQRALRSGTANQLLPYRVMAPGGGVATRTSAIRDREGFSYNHLFVGDRVLFERVARGLDVPTALTIRVAAV